MKTPKRVNYQAILAANAQSAQRAVDQNAPGLFGVHPETGQLLFCQKFAARVCRITPRAFRDAVSTPDHDLGRGRETFYDANRIAQVGTARALKAALGGNYKATATDRVATGDFDARDAAGLADELTPDFNRLTAYAKAALEAGHIDAAGAIKVRLLVTEVQRVISEHDCDYGHGGELSEVKHTPDPNPKPLKVGANV